MGTGARARGGWVRWGFVFACVASATLALGLAMRGSAPPGSSAAVEVPDRPQAGKVEWTWYYRRTPREVEELLGTGERLVGVEVARAWPLLVDVAVVHDARREPTTRWWLPGSEPEATGEDVGRFADRHTARAVAVAPYVVGDETRFVALFVANGTDAKGWWWYFDQSKENVDALLAKNDARPIDLRSYLKGGTTKYVVVMVPKKGSERTWWYARETAETVRGQLKENRATLSSLHAADPGATTFDVIMNAGGETNMPDSMGVSWVWGTTDTD
jgi:hypothetical protein